MNSINNMSENKTEVKARIMPAEDGSIKVVFFSAPTSPPLLGAKACACALVAELPSPPNTLPFSQASGAKNAPAEDVTVAESGASIKEFPVEEPALAASAWHSAHVRLPTHSFIRPA